jgi:hypothetical protein
MYIPISKIWSTLSHEKMRLLQRVTPFIGHWTSADDRNPTRAWRQGGRGAGGRGTAGLERTSLASQIWKLPKFGNEPTGFFTSNKTMLRICKKGESVKQGCQIFLGTKYQKIYHITTNHELYQMSIKYNKRPRPKNGPSVHKIYQRLPLQDPP